MAANFENRRVIIRERENDTIIADTIILAYDKERFLIQINNESFNPDNYKTVTLLILSETGVYEYLGTVKRVFADHIEIGLYKGKPKENRHAPRYEIHTEGRIKTITILTQKVHLKEPITVEVINISKKGVLIKTLPNTFYPEIMFDLEIVNQVELILTCLVVWVKNVNVIESYYGCKFVEATRRETT